MLQRRKISQYKKAPSALQDAIRKSLIFMEEKINLL